MKSARELWVAQLCEARSAQSLADAEGLAAVGGVTVAARGGSSASHEKDRVAKNCLRNRGYKVFN